MIAARYVDNVSAASISEVGYEVQIEQVEVMAVVDVYISLNLIDRLISRHQKALTFF